MRDALELEWAGVPSAVIIAEPLMGAAEAMKRLSGMAAYEYCLMDRPYSNMAPEELRQQARRLAPRITELLTKANER